MFFYSATICAIFFFATIVVFGLIEKNWLLIVVNTLMVSLLVLIVWLEKMALTSSKVIQIAGGVLLLVMFINMYLLLKKGKEEAPSEPEKSNVLNYMFDGATFITSQSTFYSEMRKHKPEKSLKNEVKLWNAALGKIKKANYKEGINLLTRIKHVEATECGLVNLIGACYQANALEMAMDFVEKWQKQGFNSWKGHFNCALVYHCQKLFPAARNMFKKIDFSRADLWKTHYYYGDILLQLGEINAALSHMNRACEIYPEKYEIHYNTALLHSKLGSYLTALIHFKKAYMLRDNDAALWYNQGNTLVKINEYQRAIESYDRALKLNASYGMAWNNKGIAYLRLGRADEAVLCYEKSLKINSEFHEALLNNALALDRQRNYKKALGLYQRFLQHAPPKMGWHLAIVRNRVQALGAKLESKTQQLQNLA